jgi:hypothetical protein
MMDRKLKKGVTFLNIPNKENQIEILKDNEKIRKRFRLIRK